MADGAPVLSAVRVGRSVRDLPFVLPLIVLVIAFLVVPTGVAIVHAFTNWNPGYESPWVGLDNFTELAKSDSFQQILKNQAFLLLGIPLWTFLPIVIAVLLNERVPAPGVFRTIFFFPATVAPAIIGVLFTAVLAPDGPLNTVLGDIGLSGLERSWLADDALVKPTLMVVLAWATAGLGVVIFSAALTTMPAELIEAAKLDRAGWWSRFFHVVLPSLRGVIGLWVVILVVTVFVGLFPWVYTLTRGGPGYSSTTLDFDIYQNALTFGYYGLAAAETVYLLILLAAVLVVGGVAFRSWRT